MNAIDLYESSRGIYVRTQNAAEGQTIVFQNKEGQKITAVNNVVFPEDGQFYTNDTVEDLSIQQRKLPPNEQKRLLRTSQQKLFTDLEVYRNQIRISQSNWHVVNQNGRSALVTLWKNDSGTLVAYIKLFNIKSLGSIPFFWSNSDFARDTGYSLRDVAQQKSELNLKPLTVVGTGNDLELDEILEQIKSNLPIHTEIPLEVQDQVVQLLTNVYSGYDTPVANAAAYTGSYEVDLGETAAPIALLTGHFVSGSYREVNEQLLKPLGSSWNSIKTIAYPLAGNETLVDSYLNINEDTHIGISSKNSTGGAAASITSLSSAIDKNPERYEDMVDKPKYKYLFNVLKLLREKSAEDGPLDLAVIYRIITKEEREEIKKSIKDPNLDKRYISKGLKSLLKNPIFKPVLTNPNYTVGYHLLSTVAMLVVEHLNKKINLVTEFFKEILSRSNMIQVKTYMNKSGDGANFSNFNVIWPPIFEGQVKFFAQKAYSASAKPNGKICFKIK